MTETTTTKYNLHKFDWLDVKSNDETALKRLYVRHYEKVEKYILANNGTIEHAKDIYQEAFICVWRNIQLAKFTPQSEHALGAYLRKVARNKWVDYLRTTHYKNTTTLEIDPEDQWEDPVEEEDRDVLEKVKACFLKLGEPCKKLLIQFYFKNLSMRAIAEKMDWTEATARNNKYRCLQKLKKILKEEK